MCVAILKTKGSKISSDTLHEAWATNRDGGGFAFAKDGKLQVFKSLDKDTFIDTLVEQMANYDSNYLIHFRIATSGFDMLKNCHPFAISKDVVFCHNGIMNNVRSNDIVSDTRFFNKDILQQMNFDFENQAQHKLIEDYIGNGNKLIFLNSDGLYKIANEKIGSWQDGVWFSNLNHACDISNEYNIKTYDDWFNDDSMFKDIQKKKAKKRKVV